MSPEYERACMAAAGLVPVNFDAPAADIGCAGRIRMAKPQLFGLCHTCARLGGHDLEPAARMAQGSAECINYLELK